MLCVAQPTEPADCSFMLAFLARRWFLLCLLAVLILGVGLTEWFEPLADAKLVRNITLATVMFLMALPLEASAVSRTVRRPWAALLGVAINFIAAPLLAWPLAQMLSPLTGAGLLVAAATPCTLASAAVWTRRAQGNDAAALMVTLLTNLTCFVVTPLWLRVLLDPSVAQGKIELWPMIQKLGMLVVLPMVVAQLCRLSRPLGSWATKRKPQISIVAQCGLLLMVLIGAVNVGLRLRSDQGASLLALDMGLMLLAVAGMHLTLLVIGIVSARSLQMPADDQIAVGIAGSQKTLMVGLEMALSCGVSILPMVSYHIMQLFLDTLVVDWWREKHINE
jgi:sodium/bile acid cotransporter 7